MAAFTAQSAEIRGGCCINLELNCRKSTGAVGSPPFVLRGSGKKHGIITFENALSSQRRISFRTINQRWKVSFLQVVLHLKTTFEIAIYLMGGSRTLLLRLLTFRMGERMDSIKRSS